MKFNEAIEKILGAQKLTKSQAETKRH